jgi:ATP-dependent Clp protease protease subunit
LNTVITEKNDKGEEVSYDVFSKLIDSRILFLYDYINDDIATDIVATLLYLDHQDDKSKISLYLNSEGGEIESVFMIYDMMKLIKSPIETFCIGSALGESALILAAGTKGMRYATKSSIICLNQLVHTYSGHADMTDAEIRLEKSKKDNNKFLLALHDCTGKSIKILTKDTDREFYMSPDDAKKYKIIDSIIGGNNENKKAK